MTEWKEYKLGEIVSIASGFAYKGEYIGKGENLLLGMGCVSYKEKFLLSGARPYAGDCAERYYAKLGDIVLATRQQSDNLPILGMPAIIPEDLKDKKLIIGANLYRVTNNSDFDNKYIYWLLKTPDYVRYIASCKTGTTVAMITKSDIENFTFVAPDKSGRERILKIMDSLDDKIDLLHRENKTLEAMAETLFRQWFIEEAKEDWEEGKLGDFVSVIDNRGKTPPYTDNITEYPIIEVNALTGEDRYVKYNLVKKYVEKDIYDFWFRGYFHKYDIFVSTVGSIGELAMCLEEKGVIAQNVIALHANNISPFYLYQYLNYNKDDLKGLDIGSVQPSIKVPHLLNMSIIIPPHDKLKEYDIIMLDIIEKEEKNIKQIQTLIQQRDSLLPKLMSGEVKI